MAQKKCASLPKRFVTAAPNTHMLLNSQKESILVEDEDYLEFFLQKETIADLISHINTYDWRNLIFNNLAF